MQPEPRPQNASSILIWIAGLLYCFHTYNTVMQTAMDDFLSALRDKEAAAACVGVGAHTGAADRDARHAACWPQSAARVLFFTVMHDPSIRCCFWSAEILWCPSG